jgi:hypothetical protein
VHDVFGIANAVLFGVVLSALGLATIFRMLGFQSERLRQLPTERVLGD